DLSRFVPHSRRQRDEVVLTRICRPSRCALYFWEAMHQVLDRYPQAQLWIVGSTGSTPATSERVRFLGVRRDIGAILAETDLFVYTPYPGVGSLDLSVVEASAAGVPSVVSDVVAVRECVFEGENGFRTPFGDADA